MTQGSVPKGFAILYLKNLETDRSPVSGGVNSSVKRETNYGLEHKENVFQLSHPEIGSRPILVPLYLSPYQYPVQLGSSAKGVLPCSEMCCQVLSFRDPCSTPSLSVEGTEYCRTVPLSEASGPILRLRPSYRVFASTQSTSIEITNLVGFSLYR